MDELEWYWQSPYKDFITPQHQVDALWAKLMLACMIFGWRDVIASLPRDNPISVDMAIRIELTYT